MPRARISEANDDVVLPKTRARKPRAVSSDIETTPTPRKRAAPRPRVTVSNIERVNDSAPRKAPTPLSRQRRSRTRNTKAFFTVLGICILLTGAGIGIGFMDKGTIDVVAVVNERNEKINKGEVRDELGNAVTQTIQVQTDSRPNGGLPMGDVVDVPPAPPVSTTTEATSTPETATTTEAVSSATTTEESI
jgi:hypothetical protein